ncbi:MAG: sodium:proton antiporter [Syntrophomonadaceae bacterium]|nr:sodium:proton antiporter [Syntrophomonadaceae bacterium]
MLWTFYNLEPKIEPRADLGRQLPVWSVIPFVGMLLSIALFPLFLPHWWEHHMGKVSAFWALLFVLPFGLAYGGHTAVYRVLHVVILDYIPFIVLLGALFTISGGIIVRGALRGTPPVNAGMLMIGTLLASWVGTTGASMLLIRPLIRAIKEREWKAHTIIFFIFMVSNIGGALTPIGDPPLFLGFLHGVPFFWTLRLAPSMAFNVLALISLYLLIDSQLYRREMRKKAELTVAEAEKEAAVEAAAGPLRVEGLLNLLFLLGVIGAVILSGFLGKNQLFFDQLAGEPRGILLMEYHGHHLIMPWADLIRDGIILLMAGLSLKFTSPVLREDNFFNWGPIKEVATLFAGIFVTMIPALALLQARGGELGVTTAAQFFWASGLLSSFLDNAPTYLTFLSLASGLGATSGVNIDMGTVAPGLLLAISAGSVFMGANTYIGNAPNFMVRSIAEENRIKMPSFFGYLGWSAGILIPLFILNTIIFFGVLR